MPRDCAKKRAKYIFCAIFKRRMVIIFQKISAWEMKYGERELCREGKIYAKPKEYIFENPQISASMREENGEIYLDLRAKRFAKCVMLE